MSAWGLVVVAGVMLVGALVQGSIGFGVNLVAGPVLALIDPRLVPVPIIMSSLVLNVLLATRERGDRPWSTMRWPMVGALPTSILGAAAVAVVSHDELGVLFGVLVLIAVGLSVTGRHPRPTPRHLFAAGAASGFMGTTTGIGGPPMALVLQRERGPQLRAALTRFFGYGSVVALVPLIAFGQVEWADLGRAAVLLPGALAGFVLSKRTAHALDHGYVRHAVLTVSGASAAIVLVRALV